MTKTACFPDILYVFFKNQICLIRSDVSGSTRDVHINTLWPSDAIWCHNTWSSSIEVITLHQTINRTKHHRDLLYSLEGNFTRNAQCNNRRHVFWNSCSSHQSPASLAFVRWIHRWPVNSLHKWPVTRKMFPLDDVIMLRKYTDPIQKKISKGNLLIEKNSTAPTAGHHDKLSAQGIIWTIWWDRMIIYHKSQQSENIA